MRILFVSNFYPPYQIGGYELLCQQVVEEMDRRGHSVSIITSKHGVKKEKSEGYVNRFLSLESEIDYYRINNFLTYPAAKAKNIRYFRQLICEFQPNVIFIWGMWSLSKQLAVEAERLLKSRVVYYLLNPWPIEVNLHQAYWDMPAKKAWRRFPKRLLRILIKLFLYEEWKPASIRFQFAPCCSMALRNQLISAGVPLIEAPIIYEGIDLEKYSKFGDQRIQFHKDGHLSLLYVGILAPHKGVHTAIEAISRLSSINQKKVNLTIVGTGLSQYETHLHNLVDSYKLNKIVEFHNPIPRTELAEFLSRYDVLLLPSTWEEPLALIMQEALASGMAVVGSATGGTKEIIVDGQNGFLFSPSDSSELANKIERLISDPTLISKVGIGGRATAFSMFDFNRMVDELVHLLDRVNSNA